MGQFKLRTGFPEEAPKRKTKTILVRPVSRPLTKPARSRGQLAELTYLWKSATGSPTRFAGEPWPFRLSGSTTAQETTLMIAMLREQLQEQEKKEEEREVTLEREGNKK